MCLATIVLTVFICIIIIQPFIICVKGDEVFCCVAWANGPVSHHLNLKVAGSDRAVAVIVVMIN